MLQIEQTEGIGQAATIVPEQDRTIEVASPTRDLTPAEPSKPDAQFDTLTPGELVTVRTRNSLYQIGTEGLRG